MSEPTPGVRCRHGHRITLPWVWCAMCRPGTAAALKQPGEDIAGTLRDEDDLLSLNERAVAVRRRIIGVTRRLYSAVLVGDPAPAVRKMYERMRAPQVGDLVVEMSPLHGAVDRQVHGYGILLAHRDEWWETDEEHERQLAEELAINPEFSEPRAIDHVWYVQYGPQPTDVCRWTNCDFVVILPPDDNGTRPE